MTFRIIALIRIIMSRFNNTHRDYISCSRKRNIGISEKGKRYSATNRSRKEIAEYRIDDESYRRNQNKRCDYVLYVFDTENSALDDDRLIFIELKGSDVVRAIKQINQSIIDLVEAYNLNPKRVDARIVISKNRNPSFYAVEERKLKSKLRIFGKKRGDLKVQTRMIKESI